MQKGHILSWKYWKKFCLWAQEIKQGTKAVEVGTTANASYDVVNF
jgi:hypothetical protein